VGSLGWATVVADVDAVAAGWLVLAEDVEAGCTVVDAGIGVDSAGDAVTAPVVGAGVEAGVTAGAGATGLAVGSSEQATATIVNNDIKAISEPDFNQPNFTGVPFPFGRRYLNHACQSAPHRTARD
jgi:hypothetical protein